MGKYLHRMAFILIAAGIGTAAAEPSAPKMRLTFHELEKAYQEKQQKKHNYAFPITYPREAFEKGWEGDVRLSVLVAPDGSIKNIKVLQSSGHKVLDKAAEQAVKQGTFRTEGWAEFTVPFSFRLGREDWLPKADEKHR